MIYELLLINKRNEYTDSNCLNLVSMKKVENGHHEELVF